jgi:hypothetical protein
MWLVGGLEGAAAQRTGPEGREGDFRFFVPRRALCLVVVSRDGDALCPRGPVAS